MKILAFADLHISNKNSKFRYSGRVNDLLAQQVKYVLHVCDLAESENVDAILFLGDWTDYPTLDTVTATYSNQMISFLINLRRPIIFLEGNHCIEDSKLQYTVLTSAEQLVSQEAKAWFIANLEVVQIKQAMFYCVPYNSDYKKLEKDILDFNNLALENKERGVAKHHILLFHFPSTNAVLDNGVNSSNGVALTQDIIGNFDICLGGDFHKPQKLVGTQNAYYVGAPFDLNFGDHVEDRGTAIIDTEDNSIRWVPNPYAIDIRKVDANDFLEMDDEDIKGNIFKVVGEVSANDIEKMSYKKSLAYRVDMALAKKKPIQMSRQIKSAKYYSRGKEVEYIAQMLSDQQLNEETRKGVLELFNSVRG